MVNCAKGMRVLAHTSMAATKGLDVLLVPGGRGTRPLIENQAVVDWVKVQSGKVKWTTSVCTGAFVLAKAGLTVDKRVTTHHMAFNEYKKLGLPGTLIKGERFVREGNMITAAGVSAGIDMALWLTGEMYSEEIARGVQSAMEYYPDPPYGESEN
jgi:transcriptional regulator GlxA family with amidase domain